ncbi:MAG: heavy metal translocating P-type ATPase [Spirochaetia bacterium]
MRNSASFALGRECAVLAAGLVLLAAGIALRSGIADAALPWLPAVVFGAAYLAVGGNVLASAFRGVIHGRFFDENFLMAIATGGAFAIGLPTEAVGVMLFFKVGEIMQGLAVARSRRSIEAVLRLRPDTARIVAPDGMLREVPPEGVAPGDEVLVRPGERVPLDGIALNAGGFADTSAITGEPVPRRVRPGQEILAGFISADGSIRIRVTRPAGESSAAQILRLVEDASHAKSRTARFITRFARVYTPLVVAAAAGIAFLPPLLVPGASLAGWTYRALTMLVIACPCALVVSIPLGYFGGVGGSSRRGILVKGATYLDVLARVNTVVFDKTGTLTQGSFHVTAVQPRNGMSAEDILKYAARAEAHSNHPIAASIRAAYGGLRGAAGPGDAARSGDGAGPGEYRETAGQGVVARVEGRVVMAGNDRLLHENGVAHDTCCTDGTAVHLVVDGVYAGYLEIGDEARAGAAEAVSALRRLGVSRTVLLSGDDTAVAQRLAAELGIDEYHGQLKPSEKVALLEDIMRERGGAGRTAFVGDGVNDAPVLARADVGIAMGASGADAAVETADVVLMSNNLLKVPEAISRGRRTRAIVVQNIVFALGVKGLFLALGALGIATMWEAVIADMGVALLAIANAVRAFR